MLAKAKEKEEPVSFSHVSITVLDEVDQLLEVSQSLSLSLSLCDVCDVRCVCRVSMCVSVCRSLLLSLSLPSRFSLSLSLMIPL